MSNTPHDGGWCVTDGGWCVTDGGWWITDGGWWVATKHQRVDAIVKKKKGECPYGTPWGGGGGARIGTALHGPDARLLILVLAAGGATVELAPQPLGAGPVVERREARLPRGVAHDGPPPAHARHPVQRARVLQGPQARRAEVLQHARLRDAGGVARDEDHADGHAGGVERVAAQAPGRGAVHEYAEGIAEGGVRDQPLARVPVVRRDVVGPVRDVEVVQIQQLRAGGGGTATHGTTAPVHTRSVQAQFRSGSSTVHQPRSRAVSGGSRREENPGIECGLAHVAPVRGGSNGNQSLRVEAVHPQLRQALPLTIEGLSNAPQKNGGVWYVGRCSLDGEPRRINGEPRDPPPPHLLAQTSHRPYGGVRLDARSQWRGRLPSSVWTRHGAVKQGRCWGSVGTHPQGNGRGCAGR